MHAYRSGQGAARARVLYFFRSPPHIQVGRKLLDAEVREALEHTHPDLVFDWVGLLREPMPPARPNPRERDSRQRSQSRRDRSARSGGGAAAAPPVVIDDETLLGKRLGGTEAARLRTRFAELTQRIARRSRTPEDRDRLLEAATGLNPDSWTEDAAIPANAAQFDARCDALASELPRRRRGRRGGKSREDEAAGAQSQAAGADQGASSDVIIGRHDDAAERNDHAEITPNTQVPPAEPLAVANPAPASGGSDDQRPAGPAPIDPDDDPATDLR